MYSGSCARHQECARHLELTMSRLFGGVIGFLAPFFGTTYKALRNPTATGPVFRSAWLKTFERQGLDWISLSD